jgi:anaerobic magnesium-protoporphyrin IX monomethyl ester cyclase
MDSDMPTTDRALRVLIVSGGFVSVKDRSLPAVLSKQLSSLRASSAPWYDTEMKIRNAAHLLALRRHISSPAFARAPYHEQARTYMEDGRMFAPPELADVILATLLEARGVEARSLSSAEVFGGGPALSEALAWADSVWLSSTLLRDLSELEPMVQRLSRPGRRLVVGGALAGLAARDWAGMPGVDVLAVGHGERLVGPLVAWMRGGGEVLVAPSGGRVERRGGTTILTSGQPEGGCLDALPTPDWAAARRRHGQDWTLIHYESARGCPFRCAFCSYPYLFDDRRYRTKSAARVVEEWLRYASEGFELVCCLDSTFTTPRHRLAEIAERLVDAGSPIRFIAYARGDDLDEPELCALLARAGCVQLQIGIESGSPRVLANMNKRTSPEINARALEHCRRAGIATYVTVILGFPGETAATIRQTWDFVAATGPDFCYATPLTVRVPYLPVLEPASRARFGLETYGGARSSSPYWRHDTMGADEIGAHWTWFHRRMFEAGVALDASLFHGGMLGYRREAHRAPLLRLQRDAMQSQRGLMAGLDLMAAGAARKLRREMARVFG